jgi:signal transduction histidine kinase/ActR/RegA family two-component response regulator
MRTSELSHVNNQLIAEIQDRIEKEKQHRELEAKLSRARKMEAIGTLAGGVAHDLNNILSGIISYPELILMDLPQDHPLRDSVMAIKSSGEKAATIVEDLLTLARRGIATHDPVDLNALVNQFIDSPECANILRHHPAVRMRSRLTPGIGSMMGSPVHLSKTIMNLVSNAAEAMPDGGTIDIVTTLKYIDFTIRGYDDVKEGEYLKLSVGDTGEGIAEEDLERIFEPFFTKKQMGRSGTGLGMAVVWGTVKDHAGYIDVKNRPGSGTTFSLYFPLNRAIPVKDGDAAIPPERYQGRGETVLVVDDVREQREIATRILEKIGYQVACVTSGEMAVAYLQQQPADILLLDMIMPRGIDGLETYRRVAEVAPGQKAVIASGFSESERVAEAQRIGAGPYIKKPYGIEQIGLVIREELDRPAIRKSA